MPCAPAEPPVPRGSFDADKSPGLDEKSSGVRPQLDIAMIQANPTRKRYAMPIPTNGSTPRDPSAVPHHGLIESNTPNLASGRTRVEGM